MSNESELKKLFPVISAEEIKQDDVILTKDNAGYRSIEKVNCVDNKSVWLEDIDDDEGRVSYEELDGDYEEIRLIKRSK